MKHLKTLYSLLVLGAMFALFEGVLKYEAKIDAAMMWFSNLSLVSRVTGVVFFFCSFFAVAIIVATIINEKADGKSGATDAEMSQHLGTWKG